MFNNWLWSGIATTTDSIYICEYSVLQDQKDVQWVSFARNLDVLATHPSQREIKVLEWLGQDKYFAQQEGDTTNFFIVKWGRMDYEKSQAKEAFFFYWKIAPDNGGYKAFPYEPEFTGDQFGEAWNRLWHRVYTADPYSNN